MAASTDSSNFFVAVSFTSLSASSSLYRRFRSTFAAAAAYFFATLAMCSLPVALDDVDPHRACRSLDRPHGGLERARGHVLHLHLGDLLHLLARDLADL